MWYQLSVEEKKLNCYEKQKVEGDSRRVSGIWSQKFYDPNDLKKKKKLKLSSFFFCTERIENKAI